MQEEQPASPTLGTLEPVDVRTIWPSESHDFTPWLLANADRLGQALGIELDLQEAEHPVGGYSLDLLGKDTTNDTTIIVENQLEASDHGHLGQLLTYAAGTGASTIVWITRTFREEHRQALDWLNEHTDELTHFFGAELQLVRIGDSAPAPLFRLVAQPNDWQKAIRAHTAGQVAGRAALYKEFWRRYLDRLHAKHLKWTRGVPVAGNEFYMASPMKGCFFKCAFSGSGRLRHELYIDRSTSEECRAAFDALSAQREEIERAYGRSLDWDATSARKACRIIDSLPGDVTSESEHDAYIDFLVDAGSRFRRALENVQLPT